MAAAAAPLFRSPLLPVLELWSGGPGLTHSVIRFGLLASWQVEEPIPPEATGRTVEMALLVPELPYSVLPFSVRQTSRIRCDPTVPPDWQGRPVPLWRGIPCRLGTAWLRLSNEQRPPAAVDFSVLVLLPDRDPGGPRPETVLLGMEFLKHYDLRVILDYSALRYREDAASGQRQIDFSSPCGYVEKS